MLSSAKADVKVKCPFMVCRLIRSIFYRQGGRICAAMPKCKILISSSTISAILRALNQNEMGVLYT